MSADFARKGVNALLDRVGGDPVVQGMVMAMAEGIETPSDLAVELGVERDEVYNARRRLNGHAIAVKAALKES